MIWKTKDKGDNERRIIMEDKRILNEDNMRVLNFEDLESVAGGFKLEDLSAEELRRYQQLVDVWENTIHDKNNGMATEADVDARWRDIMDYTAEMDRKYS